MKFIGLVALLIVFYSMSLTDAYAATTTNKVVTNQSVSTKKKKVKVKNKTLALRSGAGIKYQAITKVKKGTTLTVLGNANSVWVKVEYKGKVGYVYNKDSKYLKEVSTITAEDTAIKNVIKEIDNISGTITLSNKEQIIKAREAYNKLSSSAKKKVTNISKLVKAEEEIAYLEGNNEKVEVENSSNNGEINNPVVESPSYNGGTNNSVVGNPSNNGGTNNSAVGNPSNNGGTNNTVVGNPSNNGETNNSVVESPSNDGGTNNSVVENPSNDGENNSTEIENPSMDAINEKAKELSNKISKLNKEISLSDQAYIESVRKEYSDSDAAVKKLVTNIAILEKAESSLQVLLNEQNLAQIIVARIDGLDREITLEDATVIEGIRSDYENLPLRSKALVYNIEVLKEAEAKLLNLQNEYEEAKKAAESYLNELDKLPEVSQVKLSDKEAVVSVRNQYEQLNGLAKDMVSQEKNQKLIDLEAVINALEIKEQDIANAAYVEELIQKLDKTIYYQDYSLIREARNEYNRLSTYAKSLVGNLDILENAEMEHAEVLGRIANVINRINEIPEELTLDDKSVVVSAREAYELLSMDEKQAIMKWELSILIFSEEKIQRLETTAQHEVLSNFSNQVKSLPSKENILIKDKERIMELKNQYYLIDENLRFAVGEEFNILCELEAQINLLESQQ
ncbi:SH3 domain-containing protein [Clostridium sp. Marseille-P299]|uniref:SH3 domain-containing protein n=1 Tax=Clostridium sp. Marseille-P299 TaxID=1805477 RepID=UPI000A969938|nr:SH3 domain-containing protein [Clostridium sp. Marseille-P299]